MQQLLKGFKNLNLDSSKYAIYGSGPMGIRGLKEINDLDIIVTDEYYLELLKKYPEKEKGKIVIGNIEIFPAWNAIIDEPDKVIERAEMIDGFKFIILEDLISWKNKMGREKDLVDIELIERFLKKDEI
jgi:hypothetical protein